MDIRDVRSFVAMLGGACAIFMPPALVKAAGAANDGFAAMKVQRVSPPVPVVDLVLRAADGSSIRLADFKGKVAVVWFFLTH